MNNDKILRASRIGHPCSRNLWYSVNGATEETNEKSKRIFELGKILEPVIINWLRNDGWKVRRNPIDESNEGISLSISVEGGTISAHPDCLISNENSGVILADIKTMNDRAFRSLKREGTIKAFPNYADQLTIYAQAMKNSDFKVDRLAIVALNKNDCEGHIDFFDFDSERFEALKQRAENIFAAQDAPDKGERFQDWCCSYCGFNHLCELCKKDTSVGDNDIPATDNQNIINAVELLSESREMEKAAKELSDEAKIVLDKEIRQQGIKSVRVHNLVLILNEITSSRFDTTAFKKSHPELVQNFMKTSTSVRYELKNLQEAA